MLLKGRFSELFWEVVFDYPDMLVHPAGKIESIPVQEV